LLLVLLFDSFLTKRSADKSLIASLSPKFRFQLRFRKA
jgi:hypothetical protein